MRRRALGGVAAAVTVAATGGLVAAIMAAGATLATAGLAAVSALRAGTRGTRFVERYDLARNAIFVRQRLAREAFDVAQLGALIGITQRNRDAGFASAGRAADAMDVSFRHFRQLEIDDVRDLIDVDAARRDIGGDQHADFRAAELLECAFALALALVAVDGRDADAVVFQMLGDLVGAALRAGEDKRALQVDVAEKFDKHRTLLVTLDVNDALRHPLRRGRRRGDRHFDRMMQQFAGQLADFAGHRGREEQVLALAGQLRDDLADRLQEAEIKHLIGLVEHEDFGAREIDVALANVVEQAAGRGNEDVDAVHHRLDLRAMANATEDHRDGDAEVAAVRAEAVCDLACQFARRAQHEHAAAAARRGTAISGEAVQDWECKSGGLAGSGLRDAKQVGT